MSDIFGSYLEKDQEMHDAMSTPRLLLAAVVSAPNSQQSETELLNLMRLSVPAMKQALQRLSDERLVRVQPSSGGLMVIATDEGKRIAAS